MEFNDTPSKVEKPEKPQSEFCDKEFLYIQPAKRRPSVYIRPYKKPTIKMDSNTTYSGSYLKFECTPKLKINYGMYRGMKASNTGKFDFDTVYNLSYQPTKRIASKSFIPKSCLSISGSHDMQSVHSLSYMNPGYAKAALCPPYRGKVCCPVPMESKTVMKESYQDFGCVKVKRPLKREFWQTQFKTDYQTTNGLSYQYIKPLPKRTRAHYRPIISAQIEKDTVYNMSYTLPGLCVRKDTITCE